MYKYMENNYGPKVTAAHKTFIQKRDEPGEEQNPTSTEKTTSAKDDPRKLKHSTFFITINTNSEFKGVDPNCASQKLADVIDGLVGQSCKEWGKFFYVPPSPEGTDKFEFYREDDQWGMEHWCSFFESINIVTAGTEWAPGTRKGKRQYLHVHMVLECSHRTRIRLNGKLLGRYVNDQLDLEHAAYVHVNGFTDKTKNLIKYVLKNAWMGRSDPMKELVQGMYNLQC